MRWSGRVVALALLATLPAVHAADVRLEAVPLDRFGSFALTHLESNATYEYTGVAGLPMWGGCLPAAQEGVGDLHLVLSGAGFIDRGDGTSSLEAGYALYGGIWMSGNATLSLYLTMRSPPTASATWPAPGVTVTASLADGPRMASATGDGPEPIAVGTAKADLLGPASVGAEYEELDGVPVYLVQVPIPPPAAPANLTVPHVTVHVEQEGLDCAAHPTIIPYSTPSHRSSLRMAAQAAPAVVRFGVYALDHEGLGLGPVGAAREPVSWDEVGGLHVSAVPFTPWGPAALAGVRATLAGPAGTTALGAPSVAHPVHHHGNTSSYIATDFGVHTWEVPASALPPGDHVLTVRVTDVHGGEASSSVAFTVGAAGKEAPVPAAASAACAMLLCALAVRHGRGGRRA